MSYSTFGKGASFIIPAYVNMTLVINAKDNMFRYEPCNYQNVIFISFKKTRTTVSNVYKVWFS